MIIPKERVSVEICSSQGTGQPVRVKSGMLDRAGVKLEEKH